MSKKVLQKIISFLLWSFALIFAIFLPSLFKYEWWSIITGALPSILRLAYEHFDGFNLAINRIVLWLINQEVSWEMKSTFVGKFSDEDIDSVSDIILNNNKLARTLQKSDFSVIVTFPDLGTSLKISLDEIRVGEDEFQKQIHIHVQKVFVPFRHSTKILKSIAAVLQTVRLNLEVLSETHSFSVMFLDNNPYLGLFLRTLKLPEDSKLNVEYKESEGANNGRVSVKKDRVVIITHSLQGLQALSSKYITLSSLNLSS